MSRERMLLDRLGGYAARSGPLPQPTTAEQTDERMESIRANLARLLNARQGMSEAAPDYGLPALADIMVGSPNLVQRMQDAIRSTIEKYEPRLRRVRVARELDEDHALKMVFRVEGVMVGATGEQRVWYETSVAPSGELRVVG